MVLVRRQALLRPKLVPDKHKLTTCLKFVRKGPDVLDPQHPCALGVWKRLSSLGSLGFG